jgi:uncharacterized protein (TIGR00255 family)
VIRSMTGFAAVSREVDGQKASVTIKSVNHRFLDIALKAPQSMAALEGRIKALVQERLTRGRVEISLSGEAATVTERQVVLDDVLIDRVAEALAAARARGVITGGLTAADVLRIPQVLEIRSIPADPVALIASQAALATLLEAVVVEALDALVVMRATEGRFLAADLDGRLTAIGEVVTSMEREAHAGQASLEARLRDRLAGLPSDLQGDAAAVAQEIVRFIARSDIDEEVVRMRSHLDHWRTLAGEPEACGRKLDFLVQEMNREINTMGSKVEGANGTAVVIGAKAELERIREQVQNVE